MMGPSFDADLPDGVMPTGSVAEVRDFLHELFQPTAPTYFYIQLYFVVGAILIFCLMAWSVVLRRLYRGKAWFVQFYPTPQGTFLIPNAVMALCSFILFYAICYSAYCFINIGFYRDGHYQRRFFLWRQIVWYPLWVAAWACAWGTLSAFPDALRMRGKSTVQRYILNPWLFNAVALGTPFMVLTTILIPSLLCNKLYDEQIGRRDDWLRAAAAADAGTNLTNLVADAKDIWLQVTKAYWYYQFTMITWTCWACIIVIVFVPIGFHTLYRIRHQVKLADKKSEMVKTFYLFPSQDIHTAVGAERAHRQGPAPPLSAEPGAFSPGSPFTSASKAGQIKWGNEDDADADAAGDATARAASIPLEERRIGSGEDEVMQAHPDVIEQLRDAPQETTTILYPALKPKKGEKKLNQVAAASRRCEQLRLIYRNLVLQYLSIAGGATTFACSAGILAGGTYASARENRIGRNQVIANLLAAWAAFVFGSAVLVAVTWRSFDPTLTLQEERTEEETRRSGDATDSTSKKRRRSSAFNARPRFLGFNFGGSSASRSQSQAERTSSSAVHQASTATTSTTAAHDVDSSQSPKDRDHNGVFTPSRTPSTRRVSGLSSQDDATTMDKDRQTEPSTSDDNLTASVPPVPPLPQHIVEPETSSRRSSLVGGSQIVNKARMLRGVPGRIRSSMPAASPPPSASLPASPADLAASYSPGQQGSPSQGQGTSGGVHFATPYGMISGDTPLAGLAISDASPPSRPQRAATVTSSPSRSRVAETATAASAYLTGRRGSAGSVRSPPSLQGQQNTTLFSSSASTPSSPPAAEALANGLQSHDSQLRPASSWSTPGGNSPSPVPGSNRDVLEARLAFGTGNGPSRFGGWRSASLAKEEE
ncbi:hypothetical protein CBOM_01767 [Ceraceosorus bombacis]|uniref:Uncharacterized protein n=1 Tax=Ceraceosorus bombacis TaxID=401625 RepID=A0A0P1BE37_9BASI|nr:hypothetical protein CBOM_01767 [Ceraceosorus bombacis]